MRKTCTDKVYNMKKSLREELSDLQERINMFYSNINKILEEIFKEKQESPSKELLEVEEEVKEFDPLKGIIPSKITNFETKRLCKYFSKGFCKQGSLCNYSHSNSDFKNNIDDGKCYNSACHNRHMDECKIYQSKKGCDRKDSCAYLHREKQSTINNDDIESAHKGKIKDLDDSIAQMTDVINQKRCMNKK